MLNLDGYILPSSSVIYTSTVQLFFDIESRLVNKTISTNFEIQNKELHKTIVQNGNWENENEKCLVLTLIIIL